MLMLLAEYLTQFESGFRVFSYLTMRGILAAGTALAISLLVGPLMIRRLNFHQVGQAVRDDGPESHLSKSGTPTMGGALILVGIGATCLLWGDLRNPYLWIALLVTLAFGAVGAVCLLISLGLLLFAPRDSAVLGAAAIIVGSILGMLGFGVASPAFLALMARSASRLPLAWRLAVRDAGRFRGRNGPVVTAILAGMAMSVTVALLSASIDRKIDELPRTYRTDQLLVAGPAAGTVSPSRTRRRVWSSTRSSRTSTASSSRASVSSEAETPPSRLPSTARACSATASATRIKSR